MRLYALEEHFLTAEVAEAWQRHDPQLAEPMMKRAFAEDVLPALLDVGEGRIAVMDDAGIDTAVLSLTTPGLQNLPAAEAVALQVAVNDGLAEAVRRHPGRLQGFATLATPHRPPRPTSCGARSPNSGSPGRWSTPTPAAEPWTRPGSGTSTKPPRTCAPRSTCIPARPSRPSTRPTTAGSASRWTACWPPARSAGTTTPA